MPEIAWLEGRWLPLEEARVPVRDRGYMFGDGVYEVLRGYHGRLWAVEPHLDRLERSMAAIGITGIRREQVRALVEEGNRRSGYEQARVYVHVTRGVAPRVHVVDGPLRPTLLVTVEPQPDLPPERYERGAAAVLLPEIRWGRRDIKSLNLLPNILAKQEAHAAGADEAILVQADGIVTEGSSHSIFAAGAPGALQGSGSGGVLVTREEGPHILPSITRSLVLHTAARLGIPTYEGPYTAAFLRAAGEVFLAGTGPGVWAITRLDGEPLGDGRPGPVTRRLAEAFFARVAAGDDGM